MRSSEIESCLPALVELQRNPQAVADLEPHIRRSLLLALSAAERLSNVSALFALDTAGYGASGDPACPGSRLAQGGTCG
jgi:hypothetical protein